MFRYVLATYLLVAAAQITALKEKRQVTYHTEDASAADGDSDIHLAYPATSKPLPIQVVYPGDLTNFYTTISSKDDPSSENHTAVSNHSSGDRNRSKRNIYRKNREKIDWSSRSKLEKNLKSLPSKYEMSESRLHPSHHKASLATMNDIPAELFFDGAGFLRYEDDSEEVRNIGKSEEYERPRSSQDFKAITHFREAFNFTKERIPNNIKFDDEPFSNGAIYSTGREAFPVDHGAQETGNENPTGIDFMTTYQKEMLENLHRHNLPREESPVQQDTFPFPYSSFLNSQSNFDHIFSPLTQQQPLLQNHRLQSSSNTAGVHSSALFASTSPSVSANSNSGYAANMNNPSYAKLHRKKRSLNSDAKVIPSELNQDQYGYPRPADQEDASSRFIPITGNFNGDTIHLNFPVYGATPMHTNGYGRPPVQTYTYSMPIPPQGRHYGSPMERFYHPSEARRYSYGILGSGNFEVIRGGVFPNERHHGYSRGYQDGRMPYGGNDYGNYGTTEIILDGPIQGFQGFDNFPTHLINALSKHSELSIRPDRHAIEDLSA